MIYKRVIISSLFSPLAKDVYRTAKFRVKAARVPRVARGTPLSSLSPRRAVTSSPPIKTNIFHEENSAPSRSAKKLIERLPKGQPARVGGTRVLQVRKGTPTVWESRDVTTPTVFRRENPHRRTSRLSFEKFAPIDRIGRDAGRQSKDGDITPRLNGAISPPFRESCASRKISDARFLKIAN